MLVDRELAELGTLAQELTKLQALPEWQALTSQYDKIRSLAERKAVSEALRGGETAAPIDQRKVDYRRGYLKGVEDFFRYPERLVAEFEKQMERKKPHDG